MVLRDKHQQRCPAQPVHCGRLHMGLGVQEQEEVEVAAGKGGQGQAQKGWPS